MINYVIREGSDLGSVKAPLLLSAGWTDYSHNNTQVGVPTDWEQTLGRPE